MPNLNKSNALKILSLPEYSVLDAAARCILPIAFQKNLDIAKSIDAMLAGVPSSYGKNFKLLLFLFQHGGFFFLMKFKLFTRMDFAEQNDYLEKWSRSPLAIQRMGFQALKRMTLASYYGNPVSWQEIGYKGSWLTRGFPYEYDGKKITHPH